MTQATLKRLIDLEGINVIERGLGLKNALWAPENDDIKDRIKRYSLEHFGRTIEATEFQLTESFWEHYDDLDDEEAPATDGLRAARVELKAYQDWELHFEPLHLSFEQQRHLWDALGWDVSNGAGGFANCFEDFARPLLAFAKGLPVQGEVVEVEEVKAEDWGAALAAEARKFNSSARRR